MKHVRTGALMLCFSGALGCTGQLGSSTGDTTPGADPSGGDKPATPGGPPTGTGPNKPPTTTTPPTGTTPAGAGAGQRPFQRLTRAEYANTLADIFGADLALAAPKLSDPTGEHGFAEPPLVSESAADDLIQTAEAAAATVIAKKPTTVACSGDETACARTFVETVGRRLYRRPVASDERDLLLGLYSKAKTELMYAHADRLRVVLSTMLLSPAFLYHWELGTTAPTRDGALVKMGPYEVGARLSSFLWLSAPDETLLDAAAAGKLDSDADLAKQIDRMVADARFSRAVESFHVQWLRLEKILGAQKDTKQFPDFNEVLAADMLQETRRFVTYTFTQGDGRLETLFSAPISFVNERLGKVYGITTVKGDALTRVDLDKTRRAGLLTQPSVIAALSNAGDTNPPRAGHVLLSDVLCRPMKPAGAELVAQFKPDATKTTRENFAQLDTQAGCASCHAQIDPLGYAYENYDPIGKHRLTDEGKTVDASGSYTGAGGAVKNFTSLVDLARLLATEPDAGACVARRWMRFALGRLEDTADEASLTSAVDEMGKANGDVRVLLKAIANSKTFRFRTPDPQEVL